MAKVTKRSPRKQNRARQSKKPALPKPLKKTEVFVGCPLNLVKHRSTKGIAKSHDIIAQDRAIHAINMGLGIRKPGYNIYVAGIHGTGRTSVIRTFLEKFSSGAPTPKDWVYVHDFNNKDTPRAISLRAGDGKRFQKSMEQLVRILRKEIPDALQSEDYENTVNAYLSASNERKSKLFSELERKSRTMEFQIKSTRMGIETIPILEGRPITDKEYNKLSEREREQIEDRRSRLEPQVLDFARKVRAIESETKEYVDKLRDNLGEQVVSAHLQQVIDNFKDNVEITSYLTQVKEDIVENLLDFVELDEEVSDEEAIMRGRHDDRDRFVKYRVNVFVDNRNVKGAPVIIASNPTYYNLFGRVEKNVEHGTYMTDLTMIQAGDIHRASGGYLVLEASDLFNNPSTWETLKRVLKAQLGFIEDMGEQYSLLPTSGLRPQPIPLDVKVILIGSDEIYHLLFDADEDFHKIFKMKADFDYKMERSAKHIQAYQNFVATRTHIEQLLPFDKSGISAMVEYGSRLVEDQRYLSTQFGEIKDLTIEADYIARAKKRKYIKREDVEEAIDQKFYRINLVEEHMLEMVRAEDLLIDVDGARIGQVNGLAVYDLGDFSFGKLGRITCTTSTSDDGIINIERASKLSGRIHDKGMYILSGFLNAVLAQERSLGISASVCFEQSYGIIDGDSASVAELVAILSSMAEIPVLQKFAMTGSINQFGDIQPVGGINEKIEGFCKVCKILGKGTEYNVIIPAQNVPNLMLHREARDAVAKGFLRIFPIKHVYEAFELATGVSLGITDVYDKTFSKNSALEKIRIKNDQLHQDHENGEHHGKSEAPAESQEKMSARPSRRPRGRNL